MAGRDPSAVLSSHVSDSQMRQELAENKFETLSANAGGNSSMLSVATVTRVDYENFTVTLRIETGEVMQPLPIPITFPGAGHRHFLGAMPRVGDIAVVGWAMQESGFSRVPYVLSWFVPGVTAGHDWVPTQPYSPGDVSFSASERARYEGIADRIRHRLRHMQPGDVLASSAQGSDLVLNESVTISNRRANEIRLRDQDQAIVFRSLQQFHALSGARVYGGMVQRDATLLPTQMISDGVGWDSARQVDGAGRPLTEFELGSSSYPTMLLTPAPVFEADSGVSFPGNLDPYVFLQRGLFIDENGYATSSLQAANYGGKQIYRVSMADSNAVTDPNVETLTEYRIEVAHTADGTLPVTEQTDNFDADRLPLTTPRETAPGSESKNAPFIEFVLGSVVGNDPFTLTGREVYGQPLRPVVFDGPSRGPNFVSGLGAPIEEHAATLFQVRPPLSLSAQPTFWSTTKDGRVMASIPGPGDRWSAEISVGAGIRFGAGATPTGESLRFDADGAITFRAGRGTNETNYGVDIAAENGAVRIYGGSSTTVGSAAQGVVATGDGTGGLPAVHIESGTNALVRASKKLQLSGDSVEITNAATATVNAANAVQIQSGDKVAVSANVLEITAMGKVVETFGGPKSALPTNAPLRNTQFVGSPATGFVGGPADQYSILMGDRLETLTAGNHTTTVVVGNQTYVCAAGVWSASAGATNLALTPASMTGTVPAGGITFTAAAGAVAITGGTNVSVLSGGPAIVKGTVVTLSAPNPKLAVPMGIVSGADLDPVSGLPLVALGMGSPTHLLAGV